MSLETSVSESFAKGTLKVKSLSSEGRIEWKPVTGVHRKQTEEPLFCVDLDNGHSFQVTESHRVYMTDTDAVPAHALCPGSLVRTETGLSVVKSIRIQPNPAFVYDLTVGDNHNLVLANSGVVVHNCPDRFYHFRPPEQEGRIGRYDKVFGRIWEEEELYEYLLRALDWWNASAPATGVGNLQQLVQSKPEWRTFVIHAAMFYACNALALNWIADQFSYSIGGLSLDINKASEYSSMAQSLASEMDKAKETKKETVKFIRGLQQPRFGASARSAFGPYVGRGILSPRNFAT